MAMAPYIVQSRSNRLGQALDDLAEFDGMQTLGDKGPLGFGLMSVGSDTSSFITQSMSIPMFNMATAYLPRESLAILAKSDNIEAIWPDNLMHAFQNPILPDDGVFLMRTKTSDKFLFTSTWHTMRLMGGHVAQELGYSGQGMTVGVVDTGGTRWHQGTPHLEFDTVLMGQIADHQGHGEWCCACIGGYEVEDTTLSREAGKPVLTRGFVPDARLVSIKALGYGIGAGSTSGIIKGVELAVSKGCKVLSMSLGGPCDMTTPSDDPFQPVMANIVAQGIIPVVAGGNEGPGATTIGSPGWLDEVLTVGAYDPITGSMADFSSRGPTRDGRTKPDCIAPGVNIDAPIIGMLDNSGDQKRNRFSPISGTSMATPHVAGLVMQMAQCHKATLGTELTLDEIKNMLKYYGKSKSNDAGWGIINWHMYEGWLKTQYGVS
jgi:subtilisin family serine protease